MSSACHAVIHERPVGFAKAETSERLTESMVKAHVQVSHTVKSERGTSGDLQDCALKFKFSAAFDRVQGHTQVPQARK